MSNKKLDYDAISKIALEAAALFRKMLPLIPNDHQPLLRHWAAASIHAAFFMRDISDHMNGRKSAGLEEHEQKFLEHCGCEHDRPISH